MITGGDFLSEEKRSRIMPSSCVYHDNEKYAIELELPGVDKKDIEFVIAPTSFCVKAARNNTLYQGCWILCHEVIPEKAIATFKEGLLLVSAPMARQLKGVKIEIE
jgi:HSP20 family molecular chaperone IbpA